MSRTLVCPNCGNDDGAMICGNEIRGVYDGVLYWHCFSCRTAFQRWPEGHHLYERAASYIDAHNTGRGNRP